MHLGSAFALYLLSLGIAFNHLIQPQPIVANAEKIARLRTNVHRAASLLFITAFVGAFVAGLDAGLVYNEFPLMGGSMYVLDTHGDVATWSSLIIC